MIATGTTAPAGRRPGRVARSRRRQRPGGLRPAAILLLACTAGAWTPSSSASTPSTSAIPVVTEIEIVPGRVTIVPDPVNPTRFVLEARLWTWLWGNRSGIPEKAGVNVVWSISGSGLRFDGTPHGYRATLVLDPGVTLTGPVIVKAEAGGIGADSYIVPATTGADYIKDAYTADMLPSAIIVHGIQGSDPCSIWLPPAMARMGNVGDITENCDDGDLWGAALLSPARGVQFFEAHWTENVDEVDAISHPAVRSVPVVLRVFLGGTDNQLPNRQTAAKTFTLLEMDDADSMFKDSRVGIDLDPVDAQIVPAPSEETTVDGCPSGDPLTSGLDYVPPSAPPGTPPVLHVYVVDFMGRTDGFTCPPTSKRPFPVIYLREGQHSGTILLHEIGHALGLDLPGAGHSDEMDHFDAANVMVSGYTIDNVWRRRFTVGQVFRITAEAGSWLNSATDLAGNMLRDNLQPRLSCQCSIGDAAGRCPRLADDIAGPRGSVNKLHSWDCSDVIRVAAAGPGDDPRALLAGREWRSPLSECHQDIPGHVLTIATVTFIQAPNLTGPGLCASYVAIFFKDHQPVFSDLANVAGAWSDAADWRPLDPTLAPRRAVTFHVHYAQADATGAKSEIETAAQVFGSDNRTGLDLTLLPEEDTSGNALTTCPPPPAGEFSVCYPPGGGASVAELVGKDLGLPDPTLTELGAPTFAANAFQAAADRGTRLTLGQVFRIHSKLQTPGFPDCNDPKAVPCPPLEADVVDVTP